ncbi:MAG: FAD-dependent oxidoreductase [Candidatus Omnitrophota bacterium]
MKKQYKNIIIGAGITGLSAAFYLEDDYLLIESEKRCGGMFNSIKKNGYFLDFGERFIRIDAGRKKCFNEIFGKDFFRKNKLYSQICLRNKRFWYPFQYNLYGMEKRKLDICIAEARKACKGKKKNKNFREWMLSNFGRGIVEAFMGPYNRKIWCEDPSRMSCDWFYSDNVVPSDGIDKIVKGAVRSFEERGGSDTLPIRYYPGNGGASSVPEFMEKRLRGPILYDSKVVKIDPDRKKVFTEKGDEIKYTNLISTIPLTELVKMVSPAQKDLKVWSEKLKYNSVLCIWVAIKREIREKCHWIYFPERKYGFSRLYFQQNFSPKVTPEGRAAIGAIFTYRGRKPPLPELKKELIEQLIRLKVLESERDIDFIEHVNMKYGFCIPLIGTAELSEKIRNRLKEKNIFSIGRYGEWKYSGMEHALTDGRSIAHFLEGGAGSNDQEIR